MGFRPTLRRLALAAAAWPLASVAPLAQTLTIAVAETLVTLDPHAAPGSRTAGLAQLFDTLVATGPALQLEPGLAQSWTVVDPTTWDFKLRQGVRFHDGSEFTAEDAKASIDRASALAGAGISSSPVRRVKDVQIVDAHTLRIVTDRPAPALPRDLSRLFVTSFEAARGEPPENAGRALGSGKGAIGTGPFRLVSASPEELVLERFDQHWRGAPALRKVVQKSIPDASSRVAGLAAGEVDVAARVPPGEMLRIERDPKLKLVAAPTPFMFVLTFDFREASPVATAKDGSPLPRNPFADARVREAADLAIDRPALAEVSLEGLGRTVERIAPTLPPRPQDAAPPVKPNRERARQLLAEAGYPDGFKAALAFATEPWPGGRAVAGSVARMLSRIGIEAELKGESAATFSRGSGGKAEAVLLLAGMEGGDEALVALGHSADPWQEAGSLNWGGYRNVELDKLLDDAATELDEDKRRALLQEAAALFRRERVALPLVALSAVWAMRRDRVDLGKPRSDGTTLAQDLLPAKP